MKISEFRISGVSAVEGVWQNIGVCEVLLAYAGVTNKDFAKTVERLCKPHRTAIDLNVFPQDQALALTYRAFAESVVLDWKGLEDENGKNLPYSVEACIEVFNANPKVFETVKQLSQDEAKYRASERDNAAKNSGTA